MIMRKTILTLALLGLSGMAMAGPDIEPLARTCNGCHGVGGVSVSGPMPSIGGLPQAYLKRIMKQWKYGERKAVTMDRIVKGFSDDQLDALAEYFAKQPWVPSPQAASETLLAKGKTTASANCRDCHGLTGNDPDVDVPKINGQWAQYLELELVKYRSGEFKMPHRKMKQAARDMKPEEVSASSRYYASQGK
jgi:sulfide dehydrogenase cytochrome subunit